MIIISWPRKNNVNSHTKITSPRAQNGKVLDTGTMRELGVVPGSVIYLEYNHALIQETEVFNTATEQGFKGTVLSGR